MTALDSMLYCQQILLQQPLYLACQLSRLDIEGELVEMAILDTDERVLLDELVKPRSPITDQAAALHGITAERVAAAPGWGEVWAKARPILKGRRVGVYGQDDIIAALTRAHKRSYLRPDLDEGQFFCIQRLFATYRAERDSRTGGYRTYALLDAALHLGLDPEAPFGRRSADDARMLRAILLIMANWKSGSVQVDLDDEWKG
ncbi:MAG TPA: hypothetical protein PKM21_09945 [Anaerolineales bacterium]|nr:hypothetical protein [Anaerolineales bacterium]